MSSARLARGTRSKACLYVCCVLVLGAVIFVFHGTQSQLDDVKKAASVCSQQQESLSAQLQVIFEYKLRLEKSLQKEKAEHRQTKEKLLALLDEEKQSKHKEGLENSNKLNTLQEMYDSLLNEQKTLTDELTELKNKQEENNKAQELLKKQAEELKTQLEVIKNEGDSFIQKLKEDNQKLISDNEELLKNAVTNDFSRILKEKNSILENQIKRLNSQLQSCLPNSGVNATKNEDDLKNEWNNRQDSRPSMNEFLNNVAGAPQQANNSSTTPFINPQAVIDHDNNHEGLPPVVPSSSARPMGVVVNPIMKAVVDEDAAREERDGGSPEEVEGVREPPVANRPKIEQEPDAGRDVLAQPPVEK